MGHPAERFIRMATRPVFKIRPWQIGPGAYGHSKRMVTGEKLKEIEVLWQPGDGCGWEGPFEVDEADLDPDNPGFTKELL